MSIHWQAAAQIAAERLLNSMAEGIVIALFAWLLLRIMKRQNSSSRFALLFSVLAAIAVMPIADAFWSRINAPANLIHPALRLPGFWAVDLLIIWAVIAAVSLTRIALGFWQLRKLRQSGTVVDPGRLHSAPRNSLNEFGANRSVTLYTSAQVRVPTAMGFFKPAVVIPTWAFEDLSADELNAVLLHELAHLRRYDDWTNLAQRIVRALLFFHPAVWWIGSGLAREREMACDDFVLTATADPRAYAQCLVSVAEKSFLRRSFALAQALVGRVQLTAQRVARILDSRPQAGRSTATIYKPALALVAAVSVVSLISLQHVPRLVAFGGNSSNVPSYDAVLALNSSVQIPQHLAARIIPASFVSRPNEAPHKKNIATDAIRRSVQRTKNVGLAANAMRTTFAQSQPVPTQPQAISTRASHPQSVLVFMQTEQVDEVGRVWSISVWHLTVFHPVDPNTGHEVRKEIAPKST